MALSHLALWTFGHLASAQVAIVGTTVHTMGPAGDIENGVVVIQEGKITAVGPAASTPIPEGLKRLEAAVVTPGLIDAHSTVGLSGLYNTAHDSDQLERSGPVQPELRAVDAYNPLDPLVEYVRSFGVTTLHTGHAPGELISGQTIIVKTRGGTVDAALVRSPAMVAATLDESAHKDGGKSPGSRGKAMAMLRQELIKAREYDAKAKAAEGKEAKDQPARDLHLEMLAAVLRRETPLLITAHRAQDIASALRLQGEFGFRLVLDGGAEAYLMIDDLRGVRDEMHMREAVPVIVHPTMMRAYAQAENASFTTAGKLKAAGLVIALQAGYEAYVPKTRIVLFEAGVAAANGLPRAGALGAITIDAARVLGIADRVGSLEVGKDGDVALYDADPLEYVSHCVGTVIEGEVVWEGRR